MGLLGQLLDRLLQYLRRPPRDVGYQIGAEILGQAGSQIGPLRSAALGRGHHALQTAHGTCRGWARTVHLPMVRRQHQVHLLRRRRRTVPGQHLAAVAAAAQVGHRAGRVQVQVVAAGLLLVVVIAAAAAVVQPAEAAGRRRVRQVGHVVQGRVEGVFPQTVGSHAAVRSGCPVRVLLPRERVRDRLQRLLRVQLVVFYRFVARNLGQNLGQSC